jgi:hypothetical protein
LDTIPLADSSVQRVAVLLAIWWLASALLSSVFEGRSDHGDGEILSSQQWLSRHFSVVHPVEEMIKRSIGGGFGSPTSRDPDVALHARTESLAQLCEQVGPGPLERGVHAARASVPGATVPADSSKGTAQSTRWPGIWDFGVS